jgi:glycosyltransferase involved in cell wall biosynthesis
MWRGPSHDVAIYAPGANIFYDPKALGGGGMSFQTSQIAKGLAERGLRVAHIIHPVEGVASPAPGLDLVQRPFHQGAGARGKLREARVIWESLREADAQVYILRGRGLHMLVAPLFARLRRRRVILSGSNDFDFTPRERGAGNIGARLYRGAISAMDSIVAQTEQQRDVALREFPDLEQIEVIPSYAEPAEPASGEPKAFLWPARIVDYKRPFKYIELAEALPQARFRMVAWAVRDETPPELEQEVRRRAAALENLELLDSRPRAELMELLGDAVAMVVTSENEGMPNVFLEAWMRAIPVLSLGFDPDGRIERERIGFAAGDDWERFVDCAQQLWEDAGLRAELGQSGRRYALATHDPAAVSAKWVEAVKRLLR